MFHFILAYTALLTLHKARQSEEETFHIEDVCRTYPLLRERKVYSVSIIQIEIYVRFVPVSDSRS